MTNNQTYQATKLVLLKSSNSLDKLVPVEKVQYGKVIMYRVDCIKCDETLFEDNLNFKCGLCRLEFQGTVEQLRIEVNSIKRKRPSKELKKQILHDQSHQCYWCDQDFETPYFRHNQINRLLPNWDHRIPFSYAQSNADDNFVASCSICNGFKNSKVFDNDEDCKYYLKGRWKKYLKSGKITFL